MKLKYLIAAFLVFTATNLHATTIDGSTLNTLSVLSSAGIGSILVTTAEIGSLATGAGVAVAIGAGVAYYAQTGKNPVYASASTIASAADSLFVPAYQAFKATFVSPESYPASAAQYIGKEGSVGATLQNIFNSVKSSPATYPDLYILYDAHSTTEASTISDQSLFTQDAIIETPDGKKRISTAWSTKLTGTYQNQILSKIPNYSGSSTVFLIAQTPDNNFLFYYSNGFVFRQQNYMYGPNALANLYQATTVNTDQNQNIPIIPGSTTVDYPAIKNSLTNPSPAIANEIKDAIKNQPSDQKITSADPIPTSVPSSPSSPITNNDISNFFTSNTTNVYNEYLNTVNNGGDVSTAQAAAELAKAQEEEAEKETEEKFNALGANPYQNPYNPGPFDIPTRFTTFLQNVKTSGLFSFSSAFFDSLPGGGSPLLTVNGGQTFGTHTFDFSQSLGGGLAILKSVLLALFGFLSVRAVIMKR